MGFWNIEFPARHNFYVPELVALEQIVQDPSKGKEFWNIDFWNIEFPAQQNFYVPELPILEPFVQDSSKEASGIYASGM